MQVLEEEYVSEEIKQMSRLLTDALLEQCTSEEYISITYVEYEAVVEEQIVEVVDLDLIASATASIIDPLGQLIEWLTEFLNAIASWIVSAIETFISDVVIPAIDAVTTTLSSAIDGAISAISAAIDTVSTTLSDAISGAITTITDAISGVIATLSDAISGAVSTITDAISGVIATLSDAISGAITTISDAISGAISTITDAISGAIATISNAISDAVSIITDAVSGAMATITTALSDAVSVITSAISDVITTLSDAISGAISAITGAISDAIATISGAISGAVDTLSGVISGVIATLSDVISAIGDTIIGAISGAIATLSDAISGVVATLSTLISDMISSFVDALGAVASGLADALSGAVSAITEGITGAVTAVSTALNTVYAGITAFLYDIASTIQAGFVSLGAAVMGFINAILMFPQWFPTWFHTYVSKPIVDGIMALPMVKPVADFFADPLGVMQSWARAVWDAIYGFLTWLMNAIGGIAGALWSGILTLGRALTDAVIGGLEGILEAVSETAKGIMEMIFKPVKDTFDSFMTPMQEQISQMYERIIKGESEGEWVELTGMFLTLISSQFVFRMVSQVLFWIGEQADFEIFPSVAIKIFGAGGEKTIRIPLKFGSVLKHLASEFRDYPDTLMRGFFYGIAIWYTRPIVRMINSLWRNLVPIELPPLSDMVEFTRRMLPLDEEFAKTFDLSRRFMALYGYSDVVVDKYFKKADELFVEVKDRFGVKRKVPLSLLYALPTASDVATMMVRDIFATIEDFQNLYKARGMMEDIGALYYFLRFRYPPPTALWRFTVRGISGLLWVTLPSAEREEIKKEAKPLEAFVEQADLKAPVELNFKHEALLNAFKTYMKWHDYARFSWVKGFASDNLIYIDTLADIPTKIDQRWLVKWGLYELLAAKQVKITSPVSEFRTKILEDTAKSEVKMDLTLFARTLQATGLHPDWVPITAVAEAMNALADERTMLRTGARGLFKEGFYDVEALEKLLAGAVMASFQVSYFDSVELKWGTGWVNQPVMFLPAERKLIELRALMDRALDILREAMRDISRGYSEWIVETYDEYKKSLTKVIDEINKFFVADYKEITGVDLPGELKLRFVEAYYKPYIASLDIWRDIYTIRRVRYWSARFVGWLIYRLAYGWVRLEDLEQILTYVKEKAKLTDYEYEYLEGLTQKIVEIAGREYIPTPMMLATLAEYLVIEEDLVEKALEERRVPEQWWDLWKSYIDVRPVADDVKGLISAYRRALLYVEIPEEIVDKVKEFMGLIGFTDREEEILGLRVALEELVLQSREYIPTPMMLASLSEYVIIPGDLVDKVLETRRVPEEWVPLWKDYIDIRPIVDDVRGLLTSYRRALLYVTIPTDVQDKAKKYADLIGFTDREWDILYLRVELEELAREAIESRREYIPTPPMLASLAEYVVISQDIIDKAFEAKRVPPEWADIWKQHIDIRPIVNDVRGLLTSYRRALLYVAIPDNVRERVEEYASLIGFTDREWEVLALRVQLEEFILQSKEYIPTPTGLASISEYVPEARGFFDKVMDARRVPDEWRPIWAKYVDLRPIMSEIKKMYTRIEDLYVYFIITGDEFKGHLEELKKLGYTDEEIALMFRTADYERYLRAWRELIGDIDRMVMVSEYSPKARNFALATMGKMIDALPIEAEVKQVLMEMWTQYIRLKPVMDEVRRYITDLIKAFVKGLITEEQFQAELEALKEWGLDDYEIMFYKAIAGMRKALELIPE